MNKTLAILAAGIGARFGGVKQLEPVGPNGEIIIDYSIHDAIAAGFNRIIFIIRHEIEDDFFEVLGNRLEKTCRRLGVETAYAYQEMINAPIPVPDGRNKPWGTGHAILSCDGLIDGPFAVINADDYYGKNSFIHAASFVESGKYGLIGYILKNTLSEFGGVTRGICTVDDGRLVGIDETRNIIKTTNGAEAAGKKLDIDSVVSMNFWCYPACFLDVLKAGFPVFLSSMSDPLKDEYLLPVIADGMLKDGTEFSVIPTDDQWFGVTYKEDLKIVIDSLKKLYDAGVYDKKDLYSDLM